MEALPADLAAILAFDETGAQFFKRVQRERVLTGYDFIDCSVSLRPGVVVEVAGPPGSGKTELLRNIALHVIVEPYVSPAGWRRQSGQPQHARPPGVSGTQAGQPQAQHEDHGHVVILDLDGKLSSLRLVQVAHDHLEVVWRQHHQHPGAAGQSQLSTADHQEKEELLAGALSRLHVVRCHSSLDLLAALGTLAAKLEAWKAAGSFCRLLLLDNVGAHFWRDKAIKSTQPGGPGGGSYAAHHLHSAGAGSQQPLPHSLFEVQGAISARLAALCRHYRLAVIASKTAAVTARGAAGDAVGGEAWGPAAGPAGAHEALSQREFMPMQWQNLVTHRVLLYPRGTCTPGEMGAAAQPLSNGLYTRIQAEVGPAVGGGSSGAGAGAATTPGGGQSPGPAAGTPRRLQAMLLVSDTSIAEWFA
ncbi:hypothetical protein HYH03_001843 [Edaphochlamys debaryana]|uniref:Uncharacterized protein n=1 Tax=Edaphochlamys debaryana TaxID=47281 RepID=A0A835YC88_9CHLO|nr:hypothetical protein HYH03_001843 [Edaphochlamys debaryana]|eukprot:KAG2500265.1 hypothetical protein HYH03_001843 [Edaphochlamys debaryana]